MSKYTEKIIQYTENKLSEKEREEFDKALAVDEKLVEEYKMHKRLDDFLRFKILYEDIDKEISDKDIDTEIYDWFESLNNKDNSKEHDEVVDFVRKGMELAQSETAGNDYENEDNKRFKIPESRKKIYYFTGVAAAVILLFFVIKSVWFTPLTNNEIASDFDKFYNFGSDNFRSQGDAKDKEITNLCIKAVKLYKEKKYKETTDLLYKNINNPKIPEKIKMICGTAFYELKKYENAKIIFHNIIQNNSNLRISASWHLGLTFLRLDDTKNAKKQFEFLLKTESNYKNDAVKIVNELKSRD